MHTKTIIMLAATALLSVTFAEESAADRALNRKSVAFKDANALNATKTVVFTLADVTEVYQKERALSEKLAKAFQCAAIKPKDSEKQVEALLREFPELDAKFYSHINASSGRSISFDGQEMHDQEKKSLAAQSQIALLASYKTRFGLRKQLERTLRKCVELRFYDDINTAVRSYELLKKSRDYFEPAFARLEQAENLDAILARDVYPKFADDPSNPALRQAAVKALGLEDLLLPTKPIRIAPKFDGNLRVLDKWARNVSDKNILTWREHITTLRTEGEALLKATNASVEAFNVHSKSKTTVISSNHIAYKDGIVMHDCRLCDNLESLLAWMDKTAGEVQSDAYIGKLRTGKDILPKVWARTGGGNLAQGGSGYHSHIGGLATLLELRLARFEKEGR